MMKCIGATVLLLALAVPATAQVTAAESSHAAAAAELVDLLQLEKQSALNLAAVQGPITAANPMSEKILQVIADFMREFLPWDKLKPEFVRVYQSAFSEAEIRDLLAFYRTPVGQRLVTEGPVLMQQVSQAIQRMMLPHMAELQRRMSAALGIG